MDTALDRALQDLKNAGAADVPATGNVEAAKNGSQWNGQKADGSPWSLIKNRQGSYNCEF